MTQPNDTTQSAYARVFAALSDSPVPAKAIATATELPYKTVTAELARLEENGQAVSGKDGSRTMWTRAAHVPAGLVQDEPLSADEQERLSAMHDAHDARSEHPVDRALAGLDGADYSKFKRDELIALAKDMEIATNPKDTRVVLIDMITRRIAERAQQKKDEARPDFAGMTVPQLREQAKSLGIKGASKMNRDALTIACNDAWEAQADAADNADGEPVAETPAPAAQSDAEPPVVPDGPWGTGDASGAPSGSVGAVLADLQAARPVSAPPAQTPARTRSASGRPAGGIVSSGTARAWARGECEGALLTLMQEQPDAEHSATSLVKTWNERRSADQPIMQPGSTAFALDAMVKKGRARLTQDKPKRYAPIPVPLSA